VEAVQPTDLLSVPHRKRMSHAYVTTDTGGRELCIYYGVKEVSFDEEHLFPFGEQLVRQSSFTAGDATSWGPGYAWDDLQPMFEALLAEGIIRRGEVSDDPRGGGVVPSLLPPSKCPFPRAWSTGEAEAITQELGGRPVEIGNVEAILSVYRVPHPALDADNRQVGEANVWPPPLRLDRETEWRVCQYSGSRYRDDRPMNVTALKAMIKHWKPMMAALLEIRRHVQPRLPRSAGSTSDWAVSDMHLFAGVALSVPSYWLMKGGGPRGPMNPVLSSMFRITDGIRMVTHEMLFLSDEKTRLPHERVVWQDLYGFAERNGSFLAGAGVCAGPRPMIEEFLATVFTGVAPERTEAIVHDPDVRALLDELPQAIDYAFLGLMSWSVVRSIWCGMSLVYKAMRPMFAAETALGASELGAKIRARLDDHWFKLDAAKIADDYERDVHMQVYVDTYETSQQGLRVPFGAARLAACVEACPERPEHAVAARQLHAILGDRLAGIPDAAATVDRLVELYVDYLRQEQNVLRATGEIQAEINTRLDRPQPTRPLTARDLRLTYAMYGGFIAQFPYLFDMLEEELGFHVSATADRIAIEDRRAGSLSRAS
jgi:hypothetical protein